MTFFHSALLISIMKRNLHIHQGCNLFDCVVMKSKSCTESFVQVHSFLTKLTIGSLLVAIVCSSKPPAVLFFGHFVLAVFLMLTSMGGAWRS